MSAMSATPGSEERPGFRCPTCDRPVRWVDNPARPFCSPACKLIDLGGWLEERYRVPGDPIASEPGAGSDHPPGRE
jgi:endogenous inhibitor of DNA gyrase (YacG/DUF329 family)